MQIILNKKAKALTSGTTVEELLKERKIRKAAVWINGRQLLSSEYGEYVIKENDDIRILRILAGG